MSRPSCAVVTMKVTGEAESTPTEGLINLGDKVDV